MRPAMRAAAESFGTVKSETEDTVGKTGEDEIPIWDAERRELRFRGLLVKHFRQPAENQAAVLEAFARAGWPIKVRNPIGSADCPTAREALHDAIKNLNRHQANRLLLFRGDGTGNAVCWGTRLIRNDEAPGNEATSRSRENREAQQEKASKSMRRS